MADVYPGMGASGLDRVRGGLSSPGPASMGGLSNTFSADTKGLKQVDASLKMVIADIKTLTTMVGALNTQLTSTETRFSKIKAAAGGLIGRAFGGSGGSSSGLSTGSFSNPPRPQGQLTAAGTPAPGTPGQTNGPGTNLTTGSFGGLGLAALGEIGANTAGSINSAMGGLMNGGMMAAQVMSAQNAAAFGGTTGGALRSYAGAPNLGASDFASGLATQQASPFISSYAAGSKNQKALNQFYKTVQGLNPTMGLAGAAQFAGQLSSGSSLNFFNRNFAGSGGLIRPSTGSNPGGVNTPQQLFQRLVTTANGGVPMSAAQMKAAVNNPGKMAMFQQTLTSSSPGLPGLNPQEFQAVRNYLGSGGNLSAAQHAISGGTVAGSALKSSTAGTALAATAYTGATTAQNALNDISSYTKGILNVMLGQAPGVAGLGLGAGNVVSKGLGAAAHGADALAVAKILTSGSGGGGGGGLLKGLLSVGKTVGKGLLTVATNPIVDRVAEGAAIAAVAGDPVTGSQTTAGMTPTMRQRVGAMMSANPNLKITSGHRTSKQQAALYALKGGRGVAKPGHSDHQTGKAADLGPSSQFGWIARNASKFGLGRPAPRSEPWHVQAMGDPSQADIVSTAQSYVGTPYVWGGTASAPDISGALSSKVTHLNPGGLSAGVDCSKLVQDIYAKLGISLPRLAADQARMGTAVKSIGSAQPGDLIFYAGQDGSAANPGHVAMYIGGGKQIAAPESGTRVQVQSVQTSAIVAIRRVSNGKVGKAAAAAGNASAGGSGTVSGDSSAVGLNNTFISQVNSLGGWARGISPLGSMAVGSSSTGTGMAIPGGSGSTGGTGSGGASAGASNMSVVQAVKSVTQNRNIQLAMLTGATLESNQNPKAVGGGGYGAWQIQLNAHPGVTKDQAENPLTAARLMLNGGITMGYAAAVGKVPAGMWKSSPADAAAHAAHMAESPAGASYEATEPGRVDPAYKLALSEIGDPTGAFGPSRSGGGMASISTAGRSGGRSVTINMPLQVATPADAHVIANKVLALIRQSDEVDQVSVG